MPRSLSHRFIPASTDVGRANWTFPVCRAVVSAIDSVKSHEVYLKASESLETASVRALVTRMKSVPVNSESYDVLQESRFNPEEFQVLIPTIAITSYAREDRTQSLGDDGRSESNAS